MSTINGCGTTRYGWANNADGSRTATVWVVLLLFPIVPLNRIRLVQPDSRKDHLLADGIAHFYRDEFVIVENLPLDWLSILRTYLSAYVLFPLVLLSPFALITFAFKLFPKQLAAAPQEWRAWPAIIGAAWWLLVGVFVLRKTRGKQGI